MTDAILRALIIQMLRAGKLDLDDVGAAAQELRRDGEDMAAQNLEAYYVASLAEPASHYEAEHRRSQFRVIDPD